MLRGNPAMEFASIHGGVEILLIDSCFLNTGISSSCMDHLAKYRLYLINWKSQVQGTMFLIVSHVFSPAGF